MQVESDDITTHSTWADDLALSLPLYPLFLCSFLVVSSNTSSAGSCDSLGWIAFLPSLSSSRLFSSLLFSPLLFSSLLFSFSVRSSTLMQHLFDSGSSLASRRSQAPHSKNDSFLLSSLLLPLSLPFYILSLYSVTSCVPCLRASTHW